MSYPAAIDAPGGTAAQGTTLLTGIDHSLDHRTLGSAVVNIETTLGTNAGTSVIKNFNAGDFAARINASNVLQQPITGTLGMAAGTISGQISNTGTIANGVYGTATYQGGTANNLTLGTPTINGLVYKPIVLGTTIATGTTASASFGDLLIGTIITTVTSNIIIYMNASFNTNNGGNFINQSVLLRGSGTVGPGSVYMDNAVNQFFSYTCLDSSVGAGTLVYHWQWLAGGGTATIYNPTLSIVAFPA